MKRVSNRGDESSRGKYGSIIKIFKTSRGRMMFETMALLAFCVALLISGSVSLAWFSVNLSVNAGGENVKIKDLDLTEVLMTVYPVIEESGNEFTIDSSQLISSMPKYDKYDLNFNSEVYKKSVVIRFSISTNSNVKISASTANEWTVVKSNFISNVVSISSPATVSGNKVTVSSDKWNSFVQSANSESVIKNKNIDITEHFVSSGEANEIWVVMKYNKDVADYLVDAYTNLHMDLSAGDIEFDSDIMFCFDFE